MKSTQKRKYNLGDYVLMYRVNDEKPISYAVFDMPYACSGAPVLNPNEAIVSKVIELHTYIQKYLLYNGTVRKLTTHSFTNSDYEKRYESDYWTQKIESEEQKLILEELVKVWEL